MQLDTNSKNTICQACLNCYIGGFCGGGCVLERDARGLQICENELETFNRFINEAILPNLKKYEEPVY